MDETIERIVSALSRNPDPGFPTAARQALRVACEAHNAAQQALALVAKQHPYPTHEVERAADEARRAEHHRTETGRKFEAAKEARAVAFHVGCSEIIHRAAPQLAELIAMIDQCFAPLVALDEYAARHGLPEARALAEIRRVAAGIRSMKALVNAHLPRGEGTSEVYSVRGA